MWIRSHPIDLSLPYFLPCEPYTGPIIIPDPFELWQQGELNNEVAKKGPEIIETSSPTRRYGLGTTSFLVLARQSHGRTRDRGVENRSRSRLHRPGCLLCVGVCVGGDLSLCITRCEKDVCIGRRRTLKVPPRQVGPEPGRTIVARPTNQSLRHPRSLRVGVFKSSSFREAYLSA